MRAALPRGGRVTAIGVGPESDSESLSALARGGAGLALPYLPGQALSDSAFAAISAVLGATLVVGITYLAFNLLADLAYRLLDPRVS